MTGVPLLLCLGKSLVVILNYALTAEQPDPCGPESYSPGKRLTPHVPEEVALSQNGWGPGPPREFRTPARSRTPYTIRTPQQGGTDTPPGAGPEPPHVSECGHARRTAWLPLEDSSTNRIQCGRRKCAVP